MDLVHHYQQVEKHKHNLALEKESESSEIKLLGQNIKDLTKEIKSAPQQHKLMVSAHREPPTA